jgi:hypothetical protein
LFPPPKSVELGDKVGNGSSGSLPKFAKYPDRLKSLGQRQSGVAYNRSELASEQVVALIRPRRRHTPK